MQILQLKSRLQNSGWYIKSFLQYVFVICGSVFNNFMIKIRTCRLNKCDSFLMGKSKRYTKIVNTIRIWRIGWVWFLKLRSHYSSLPTLVNRTEVLKMLIFSQPPHDEPLLPRKYIWVNFMHHHSLNRVNKVAENIY